MQNNSESSANQMVDNALVGGTGGGSVMPPGAPASAESTPDTPPAAPPASKKTTKKKASKKKASKKKASKKKASKKKASKKKASKKKASKKKKKKASRKTARAAAAAGTPWERLADAAEEMRKAALDLAEREADEGRKALNEFVGATRDKLSDLESMAERGIARLTNK